MRKTRLVILPGVRSITQIGCLLLFLACPTIAFKGQEKRDVEPMCKFHELKYWWLPFDTGEGNNSTIPQKWPGYECQRENMATTNGKEKDNVTDSIQHSCDETTISHRRVAIQGQDENYNLEINFRRNKMRVIHSSPASEMPSKRIGSSERRTAGRREVPQTVYKNERVSQTPVERRVAFYQYQRSTPDRQTGFSSEQGGIGSRARTMIRNRFQQNRREGSETKVVNDRRRLVPVSERRDEYKKIRLSTRINTEFTGRYQHLESQQDSRARSEQSDKRVSALVCIDKRGELNRIKRDNNSPQQNILQRLCSSPLLDRKENAQRSCPEYHNSRIFQDKARKDRKLEQNSSPTRQEIRETIHHSRVRIIQRKIQEEQPRMDRQRQSVISIDNERSLSDKRRAVRSVDSSLDRRMREDNIQRNVGILGNYRTPEIRSEILRESRNEIHMKIPLVQNMLRHKSSPIYKTSRETTNRSAITIIQRTNDEEQSRMVRRHGSTISRDDERSLSDRKRPVRSVDSLLFSLERKLAESDMVRNSRIRERDISRENIPPLQNRRLSSPENTQRSSFVRVQPKDSREQSRIERILERAMNNDNERLSNRRSLRPSESRVFSLDRRMGMVNQRDDIRKHERDISGDNGSPIHQRSSYERRENIRQSPVTTGRSLESVALLNDKQRLSNRRTERSVESHEVSLNRRRVEPNQRRDIRMHKRDISPENGSLLQNMLRLLSSPEQRENLQRSSFIRVQGKDNREQSRIDRRIERAVNNDNERLSRSKRSVDSCAFSLDRRVGENNLQRDIRMHERDIYRENALRLENKLQRRSSFQRRENIQRSSLIAEQLKDSREQSRTDRRIERAVNNDNEQRLSRSMRSVDSRASSLDRRVGEPNQRRDIRLHEKEISHENSSPLQNMLRRLSSPERRENIQRSSFIRVQPKDSREQSRIDRRLERAVTNDNERRMSNRRAARSADSRVSSLDRRVGETNQRRDIRMHEREIPREERSSLIIVQPKDSREQSRIDRRLERAINNDNERRLSNKRSVRSVDTRVLSLEKRVGRLNTREDIRKHERDISRDSISPVQITLQQRNSLDRRETILQSPFTIIKSKESREQYRTNRKLERVVSINDYQRLSNRRAERCLESREVSIERRMGERRDIVIQKRISRANVLLLQNNLQRRSSSERREIILRSAVIPIHSRELEDLPTDDRKYKRGVYMGIEQRTQRRDISRGNSSPLQQRNSVERRENIRESTITIAKPKDSRGQSRTGRSLELVARINEEQRLSNGWEERSLESHEVSLNRRRVEPNQRRDIRMQKRDISRENASLLQNMLRRLSSPERRENLQRSSFIRVRGKDNRERSVDSRASSLDRRVGETNQQRDISREDALRLENKLQRRSSFERRENIQRSSLIVVQLKDSREQSRTDRRIERAVNNDNEQRLSRSRRSIDSRASSLDRRVEELNQRRNIRLHERYISRENSFPLQNMLRRLSSPERRGNLQRSSFLRVRGKDNREQSRIDRRIERAVNNDNERLSRSKRSVDFRASSLERRVGETNQQRDISREETSPIQNMLRRLSTPEQRENIQRSSFIRIQPKDSREQSRIDRSLERGVYNDNEQRLSNRRLLRSVESRVFSSERKFAESDLQRDGRIRERDLSRENIPPVQNKRLSSPENTQRSLFIRVQPKDSREQSRIDRRLERSVTNDNERRLSNTRSLRSVESRVFSLERMLTESDLQRDGRIRERDLSRENIPPLQNRRLSSPERRENIQRSSFIRVQPKDSREQSSMVRRLERSVNNENERRLSNRRSLRAVESQFYSLDRRMTNLREDISKDEKGISRDTSPIQRNLYERRENILQSRIDKRLERGLLMDKEQVLSSRRSVGYDRTRSNMLRDSRNTIRENTFQLQNSLRQLSSSALIDRRESSHRSVFSIIKPTDLERQSRGDTRLKSAVSIDNEQRLSDKRLVRSVDSRVFLLDGKIPESRMDRRNERARYIDNKHLSDMRRSLRFRDVSMYRRMTESRLWRDRRIHEKDMSREESFPRRLQTGVSSASSAQRFRERRTVVDSVEISPERKFETSSRRNKLDNVDRREDVSRFNKRHTQERRVMLSQRSISERTNDLHRQTSSSELHLRKKPSSSRQSTDIPVASTVRVSKYELYLSTMLDMSQNYDDAQLSNTRKSASSFPAWNGNLISAIKKAVTGSDVEETILKDSGLKSSQGFALERQIREIRPDSEIRSNDKGHLLQDFVMGSVIAGFFISSIHQKLRDYRNFICIF